MESAIFGLVGALIGAGASVVTIWLQQKYQHRREIIRIASELAREDYDRRLRIAPNGLRMPPIAVFVYYHQRVLEELDKGSFSPAVVRKISEEQEALLEAYEKDGEALKAAHENQKNT